MNIVNIPRSYRGHHPRMCYFLSFHFLQLWFSFPQEPQTVSPGKELEAYLIVEDNLVRLFVHGIRMKQQEAVFQ